MEFTVCHFAQLVNIDRQTLAKRLNESKAQPVGRSYGTDTYRLADLVHAASGGDEKQLRLKKLRAESLKLELRNQQTKAALIECSLVERRGNLIADKIVEIVQSRDCLSDTEKKLILADVDELRTVN